MGRRTVSQPVLDFCVSSRNNGSSRQPAASQSIDCRTCMVQLSAVLSAHRSTSTCWRSLLAGPQAWQEEPISSVILRHGESPTMRV